MKTLDSKEKEDICEYFIAYEVKDERDGMVVRAKDAVQAVTKLGKIVKEPYRLLLITKL